MKAKFKNGLYVYTMTTEETVQILHILTHSSYASYSIWHDFGSACMSLNLVNTDNDSICDSETNIKAKQTKNGHCKFFMSYNDVTEILKALNLGVPEFECYTLWVIFSGLAHNMGIVTKHNGDLRTYY